MLNVDVVIVSITDKKVKIKITPLCLKLFWEILKDK